MRDVATAGRTVLFVSHNMTAVRSLCTAAICMGSGRVIERGEPDSVMDAYQAVATEPVWQQQWDDFDQAPGNEDVRIRRVALVTTEETLSTASPFDVEYEFWLRREATVNISTHLRNAAGEIVFNVWSNVCPMKPGIVGGRMRVPGDFLNNGCYTLDFMVVRDSRAWYNLNPALSFEVHDYRKNKDWHGSVQGAIRPVFMQFPLVQLAE
jgi:lipopolysaccharide transport system ATP-binding protein